ncbi:MAG: heme-binding domain-containing protein, partial [Acidobacteriota bacterium]|nr:heme-binding domain-containing protein [Acidobacteriota bacterium]
MHKARFIAVALFICVALWFITPSSQAIETKPALKNITFTKDVAPIFFKSCAECHRAGEAAPFSVMSYKDVRPWAKSIREQVASKQMPPWHADPKHSGHFQNDRSLTQTEIDTITAWVDGGAAEGNAKDLPPAPKFVEGWRIG